ncbi:MAG: helix-turn-helix domain-containing protein, partial [Psittacicella sp.]
MKKSILEKPLLEGLHFFWENGYYNTSIRDLKAHLKLNTGSIYYLFSGKQDFYNKALKLYIRN